MFYLGYFGLGAFELWKDVCRTLVLVKVFVFAFVFVFAVIVVVVVVVVVGCRDIFWLVLDHEIPNMLHHTTVCHSYDTLNTWQKKLYYHH